MPESKRKGVRVTVRLAPADLAVLERLAKRWGVTVGAALRKCLDVVAGKER